MENNIEISKILNPFTIYSDAPEKLSDALLELTKILVNYKAKNGENETYKIFKRIENSMLYSLNFINDISKILKRNNLLEAENRTLKQLLTESNNELSAYKIIEREILNGSLETKKNVVTKHINNNG